jgi:hypothetical protein
MLQGVVVLRWSGSSRVLLAPACLESAESMVAASQI